MIICRSSEYFCKKSRLCIPKSWVCDGNVDCGLDAKTHELDNTDESVTLCGISAKCLPTQLNCGNGECLDIQKFCDKNQDCDNDEIHCNNKTSCDSMKCPYHCKVTPFGPKCYCAPGLQPNGNSCEDLDECQVESVCDQICNNTPGSYKCMCVSGYTMIENKCQGINSMN